MVRVRTRINSDKFKKYFQRSFNFIQNEMQKIKTSPTVNGITMSEVVTSNLSINYHHRVINSVIKINH